jgi:ADP-ribosylation factor GTPase-activating protein 1
LQLAESDIAAQARLTAANVAQNVSRGAQGAATTVNRSFNNFVEGSSDDHRAVDPEKKDFWDSFGKSANSATAGGGSGSSGIGAGGKKSTSSAIGTSAMKSSSNSTAGGGGGDGKEDWGDNDNW